MTLPEILISALPGDYTSCLEIHGDDEDELEEIAEFFYKTFYENWEEAKKLFEEEVGDVLYSGEEPLYYGEEFLDIFGDLIPDTEDYDNCGLIVLFIFGHLFLNYDEYEYGLSRYGIEAFNNSINALKEKYPNIKYEGVIQYINDYFMEDEERFVSFEVPQKSRKKYAYIGKLLDTRFGEDNFYVNLGKEFRNKPSAKGIYIDELQSVAEDYRKLLSDDSYQRFTTFLKDLA